MKILQVNASDRGGGAERIAFSLFSEYRRRGHTSWFAVGVKNLDDPDILAIPTNVVPPPWSKLCWRLHGHLGRILRTPGTNQLRRWLWIAAQGQRGLRRVRGLEEFDFPGSRQILEMISEAPDIVHLHNLHGAYFDLRHLSLLSKTRPLLVTLHDQWMTTGHCAYSLDCTGWRTGCGQCPYLDSYPPIEVDGSARNWRRKRDIYRNSELYVTTPSHWLMQQVGESMLDPIRARVIPNGVDIHTFRPAQQVESRLEFGLPPEKIILFFAATQARHNRYKDYSTIEEAVARVVQEYDIDRNCVELVTLGNEGSTDAAAGGVSVHHLPFETDMARVARYYQAADIFLHAAHADTFPTTILEALACGVPVVATSVGGISEQIEDGFSGFLVPPRDSGAMAARVASLVADPLYRRRMGEQAAEYARKHFSLEQQVDAYLAWYEEVREDWWGRRRDRSMSAAQSMS